jgi:NSS family neurotransmitter:Na+ symporter
MATDQKRGAFASQVGFVLAAAGSAIGLGNIWRFPYTAGENGGGAFVLVYLACVLGIGIPVLLVELALGRRTGRGPVGALAVLAPGSAWPWLGRLGILTGFCILAFYCVVAGWTLGYAWKAATGAFAGPVTAEQSGAIFAALIGNPGRAIGLTALFLLLTAVVVRKGVSGGIERASKILMPLFFLLLVALAARALTLEGAGRALDFLFQADFARLSGKAVLGALGQALFSLSLGMGAMITYGSYLSRKEQLPLGAVTVAFCDTLVALVGGLVVFPALFHAGVDPAGGPGLVFVVLPTIFHQLPGGTGFAVAFYLLLAVAALTSTISLLEVVVSHFVDERKWPRERTTWLVAAGALVLALPSALGNGAVPALGHLLTLGGEPKSFLDVQDLVFGNLALTLGALGLCLFVGWRWGPVLALGELTADGKHVFPLGGVWALFVKYVCPVAVVAVLVSLILG